MNKIRFYMGVLTAAGALCLCPPARAFTEPPPVSFEFLDAKGIEALSDDKLVDAYIETVTEIEAERMLFTTVAFSVKEYGLFKDVVRYRLKLLMEINRRKLEIPSSIR